MERLETRIEQMSVYRHLLTYAHGKYVMSAERTITDLESTVVVLRASDGTSGYGEVCPLGSTYLPAFAEGARAALKEIAAAVVGQSATNIGRLHASMDAALAGHSYAKSVVDIAAFDLFGKLCGMPVCELLGGRLVTQVPLYVAVPLGSLEQMVDFVLTERARGTHRFQLKVGSDADTDIARVRAVVEATGEGDSIVADANGGWRLPDAVQVVTMLEGTPRLRIEQPCRSLEECLQVRRRTSLPMVLDEVITDLQALLRVTAAQAIEGINLKISRVGGLLPARAIRDVCVELGLSLLIEDTWGGDLCTAAVAALAGSTSRPALWAASFMNDWTLEHVAGHQPRSVEGWGPVPKGPGLGVEVEEDRFGELLFEARATTS